ncbi:MAG TPA: hypothetical protein VME68_07705 [Acidobacteriaceae bacterium]|nr:hypothetical protein [Acidobacteriaceae bacterium]
MNKKLVLKYVCVILAGIVSGLCIPNSWYVQLAHTTIASIGR